MGNADLKVSSIEVEHERLSFRSLSLRRDGIRMGSVQSLRHWKMSQPGRQRKSQRASSAGTSSLHSSPTRRLGAGALKCSLKMTVYSWKDLSLL